MTVSELEGRMSSSEYQEWHCLYLIEQEERVEAELDAMLEARTRNRMI